MEYFIAILILSVLVCLIAMIVMGHRSDSINVIIFFVYILSFLIHLVLDVKRLRGVFKKTETRLVVIALNGFIYTI